MQALRRTGRRVSGNSRKGSKHTQNSKRGAKQTGKQTTASFIKALVEVEVTLTFIVGEEYGVGWIRFAHASLCGIQ